ncbi:MAG: arginine--tRNA ligase [Nitrosopumilaceae archaeon]
MTFKILIEEIHSNLQKIIDEQNFPSVSFVVEPSKPNFGDVTCNIAFLLSKHLKKKPHDIALSISENYQKFLGEKVKKVEAHPSGYINFFANMTYLNEIILKDSMKNDYGDIDLGKKSKIIVEHTSVNPNKALHIGHVRNVVIGDTVSRLLRKANYDVRVLNYIDDSGLQVADIIVGFKHCGFPENPQSRKKFAEYCGDEVYVKTTKKYLEDPSLEKNRSEILQDLENPNSEIAKFAETITKKILADQLDTCWGLGATYDCLNFESQIIRSGLWNKIFEKMKEMKLVELEKEGKNANCWVIRGEKNEDDKILVRSNGTATYIAKDIPYAAWKLGILDDPFNYQKYALQKDGKTLWQTTLNESSEPKQNFFGEKVITVIDSRQSRLQKIITTLMSQFTSKENSYVHLGYESVTLSSETAKTLGLDTKSKQTQMSGRKGLYVNADSVFNMLKTKAFQETRKRNLEMSDEDVGKIVYQIVVGTLRYEMIKQDLNKIITFDFVKSLSLEGDTAPYILYTNARASRILEKAGFSPNFDVAFDLLQNEYEVNLVKLIGKFDLHVQDAAKNLSPKVISKYCHDLAVAFNAFYEKVRVLDPENKTLTNVRLCLVTSFKSTLQKALYLIGITAPDKM